MAVTQLEFSFVNTLPKAIATSAGFWGKCKNVCNFFISDWGKATGIEYHAFKKTLDKISIFTAYQRYFDKALENPIAIKAACQADRIAKAAGQTVAGKGFWKSIGGLFGKYAGPILMMLEPIMNVVNEISNGGNIISITKEFIKGLCGVAGYQAGTLFATAVLGLTSGFWAGAGIMVIGALGGMAFNYVAKAILGESTGEKLARQKEEQQNNPFMQQPQYQNLYQQHRQQLAGNSFGCGGGYNQYNRPVNIAETMQKVDATFRSAENIFMNRNNAGYMI